VLLCIKYYSDYLHFNTVTIAQMFISAVSMHVFPSQSVVQRYNSVINHDQFLVMILLECSSCRGCIGGVLLLETIV